MKQIKRKIGLLGLSADPPHLGHLAIAKLLLAEKLVEQVWLVPCYEHSFGKSLSSPEDRWQMVLLLQDKNIIANQVELQRQGKSYTIDTIKALQEEYRSCEFFWIVGSDIIKTKTYKKWRDWPELASRVKFLVVPRSGFKIRKAPAGFTLIKGKIMNVSSSEIRERVKLGLSIDGLVLPKVKEYVKKHNLYKD